MPTDAVNSNNFPSQFRERTLRIIESLKSKSDRKRTFSEKIADSMTAVFGTISFLLLNLFWFALWMLINLGFVPVIPVFDPYPFGLLTMIVSLEAIGLAVIVLISQNRTSRISELREESSRQIDMITEQEVTKILHILVMLLKKHGIDLKTDEELQFMMKPTEFSKIEKVLERQVSL